MATTSPPRKVLLIGWDAADWKVIHPLLDAGKMPNLERFLEQGVMGNIATLQPALSPMLWTSIATGKRPYKHGVHGFSEPDPVTGAIRPVTNLSRKTKAVWNMLNQEGKNTITIGWWPSNPAEPLSKGVMVSNDYQQAHGATYEPLYDQAALAAAIAAERERSHELLQAADHIRAGLEAKLAALSAALAEKERERDYLRWRMREIIPLFEEARDALCAISLVAATAYRVDLSLGSRMDAAGTRTREEFDAMLAAEKEQPK